MSASWTSGSWLFFPRVPPKLRSQVSLSAMGRCWYSSPMNFLIPAVGSETCPSASITKYPFIARPPLMKLPGLNVPSAAAVLRPGQRRDVRCDAGLKIQRKHRHVTRDDLHHLDDLAAALGPI